MQYSIQLSEKLYYIGLLIIILVSSMLGFYLAQIKSFDSFTAHDLVPINNMKDFPLNQEDYVTFVKTDEIPGFIYIGLILSDIMNLSAEYIMFVPLGSIILPLGYAVLVKNLSKKYLYALLLSLYIILDGGLIIGFYNIFKYTLTYFLGMIILSILLFSTRYKENTKSYYLILIIIFLGMVMIHYTLALLMLLIFIVTYTIKLSKFNNKNNINIYVLVTLAVIFIVAKSPTIITYFIQFNEDTSNIFENISNRINTYLLQKVQEEYVTYQEVNQISMFLRAIRAIFLIIPIISYVILKYLFKMPHIKPLSPIIWGIISATIVHAIIYINIGSSGIINNSMLIFYPLITVIIFQKIVRFKNYIIIYLIFLIIINCFSLILALNDIDYSTKYTSIKYSHHWYYKYLVGGPLNQNERILIDHKTMGLYAMIKTNERISPLYFTTNRYDMLIDSKLTPDFKYAILHLDNKPIISTAFKKYIPPLNFINNINNNTRLNIISSDSLTVLYSTRPT